MTEACYHNWPRSVTVSALDSEPSNRGSNAREVSSTFRHGGSPDGCVPYLACTHRRHVYTSRTRIYTHAINPCSANTRGGKSTPWEKPSSAANIYSHDGESKGKNCPNANEKKHHVNIGALQERAHTKARTYSDPHAMRRQSIDKQTTKPKSYPHTHERHTQTHILIHHTHTKHTPSLHSHTHTHRQTSIHTDKHTHIRLRGVFHGSIIMHNCVSYGVTKN